HGGLEYKAKDGRSGLMALSLDGDLASGVMMVQSDGLNLGLNNLHGRYAISKGQLSAQDVGATLLGGAITAKLSVRRIDEPNEINLRADLKNISIDQLKTTTGNQSTVPLSGVVHGTVNAESKAGAKAMRAHADLNISGQVENRRAALGAVFPVT